MTNTLGLILTVTFAQIDKQCHIVRCWVHYISIQFHWRISAQCCIPVLSIRNATLVWKKLIYNKFSLVLCYVFTNTSWICENSCGVTITLREPCFTFASHFGTRKVAICIGFSRSCFNWKTKVQWALESSKPLFTIITYMFCSNLSSLTSWC